MKRGKYVIAVMVLCIAAAVGWFFVMRPEVQGPFQPVNADIPVYTSEEFYGLELLRYDWSYEEMESRFQELGLVKEMGEVDTYFGYVNDQIRYMYDVVYCTEDHPGMVEVIGPCAGGPRGIQVGDRFEDVMNLFPQLKDWKADEFGAFYGQGYEWPGEMEERVPTGRVSEYENTKDITLMAEESWFVRFHFVDDILDYYQCYTTSGC